MKREPCTFAMVDGGPVYSLRLDAPTIERIRAALEFDPVDLEHNPFDKLEKDPVLLVNCCWMIAGPDHGLSAAKFGEALVSDALKDALVAMVEAIAFFFPTEKRLALLSIWNEDQAIAKSVLEDQLNRISDPEQRAEMEAKLTELLDLQVKNQLTRALYATNLQESSVSAPPE